MWNPFHKAGKMTVSGAQVSLEELIALRQLVMFPLQFKKEVKAALSGRNVSKIRGRGIEFDTTREYHPGDDIRRMAWRVTARNLKPHVKVYHEERERPVWLAVDLSPSLYFGTRTMFKSVRCIKQAGLLGWSHLQNRERIGAFIATDNKVLAFKPQIRESEFLVILKKLAECSKIFPDYKQNNALQSLLLTLQQHMHSGNIIFILSDFFQFDETNKKLIAHLAERTQVHLCFVYDPFEATSPPPYQYVLTNGQDTALFNMHKIQVRQQYEKQFQEKLADLTYFSRQYGIAFQVLRTDQALTSVMAERAAI